MRNIARSSCIPVDRSTPLGNPFIIGKDGKSTPATNQFNDLYNLCDSTDEIKLECWCSPLACHADIIKLALDHETGNTLFTSIKFTP